MASRAPRLGSRPIGLPMISPSSAKQSAIATAQYSARVTSRHSPPPSANAARRPGSPARSRTGTAPRTPPSPRGSSPRWHRPSGTSRRARRSGVQVVKCAPLGVSTTPATIVRLSSIVWIGGVDGQPGGVDDLLGRHVGLLARPCRTGRRSRGRGRGTARCRTGRRGSCAPARRRARARVRRPAPRRRRTGLGPCAGRVVLEHGGAEPGAHRQERHPLRRGAQPGLEHPLVPLAERRGAPPGGPARTAARAGSSRASRTRTTTLLALPDWSSRPTSGPAYDTIVRSFRSLRRISRTSAIGLRREPQPPMPTVIPSSMRPMTSSADITLLGMLTALALSVALSVPAKSSRSSSDTPARLSSIVNPCSNR